MLSKVGAVCGHQGLFMVVGLYGRNGVCGQQGWSMVWAVMTVSLWLARGCGQRGWSLVWVVTLLLPRCCGHQGWSMVWTVYGCNFIVTPML